MGELGDAMHETTRQPIVFDRESSTLRIGDRTRAVPDPSAGNEAILRCYLGLVEEVRGRAIGSGIELRHDDVVVLAEVLDLTDAALETHLADLLGVSANDAADVHRRIRRHRALTAAASFTVGGLALLGANNVVAAAPAPTPASQHMVGYTTSELSKPAAVVVAEPVVVASAPMTTRTPAAAAQPEDDTVEIGDALVIERGDQPADPSVQIGDTVTYER